MDALPVIVFVCAAAVVFFDFTNGFHDASNMVATLVASRALSPLQAIGMITVFGFIGPFVGGTAVADTVGGFVTLGDLAPTQGLTVVLAGLLGAIAWNLLTWHWGIPSSSSHALVGALCGAVLISIGPAHVLWGTAELRHGHIVGVTKIVAALLLSPLLGMFVGFLLQRVLRVLMARATWRANRVLKRAQWITSAGIAFAHGTNDAQKGMGILTLVLVTGGALERFVVPGWVIVLCASSIAVGTMVGGWRIVKTLGFGIYRIRPIHAMNSQLASAGVILGTGLAGGPVSTTHVVTASILGVGAAEHPRAVRWRKAREILVTWLVTIPGAGLLGAAAHGLIALLRGGLA